MISSRKGITGYRNVGGSFLYVPAGAVHFDGAKQDTVLVGTAIGPWSTDYVINN